MGFFGWECAISGRSIRNVYTDKPTRGLILVAPNKNDNMKVSSYDGYGNFAGVDIHAWLAVVTGESEYNNWSELDDFALEDTVKMENYRKMGYAIEDSKKTSIKIVFEDCYNGELYEDLPSSNWDESQGFFEETETQKKAYKLWDKKRKIARLIGEVKKGYCYDPHLEIIVKKYKIEGAIYDKNEIIDVLTNGDHWFNDLASMLSFCRGLKKAIEKENEGA